MVLVIGAHWRDTQRIILLMTSYCFHIELKSVFLIIFSRNSRLWSKVHDAIWSVCNLIHTFGKTSEMKISEFQIWWDGLYHRYHIGKNRGFLLSRSLRKKWGNLWRLDRTDFTAVLPRKMTWKLSQFLEHLTPDFASYVSRIEISTLPRGPASRAGSRDPHDISRTRILSKNACFCSQKL